MHYTDVNGIERGERNPALINIGASAEEARSARVRERESNHSGRTAWERTVRI